MKKLVSFKSALLMSAVALSVLSSPLSAVSEEVVREYLRATSESWQELDASALERLMALNDTRWTQFKRTAQSLMTPDMAGSHRARVIKALGKVEPGKWDEFVTTANSLITQDMSGYQRADVIAALGNVAPAKLFHEKFTEMIESLKTKDMNGCACAWVIKGLGNVSPAKWDEFVTTARQLMAVDMNGFGRAWVIEGLGNVEPEKWDTFIGIAQSLMTEKMNGDNRAKVIEALGKVNTDKLFHEKFLATAQSLMTEKMNGDNRAWVIAALGKVNTDKLFHEKFLATAQSLMTEKMNGDNRAWVIAALGEVEPAKWDQLKTIATSLTIADVNGWDRAQVIKALGNVNTDKLFHEKFAATAQSLMTDDMNGWDRSQVITALGHVAPEKWDRFKTITISLTKDMNVETRAVVIRALASVPAAKIDRVYGQIQRLMQVTPGKIQLTRNDAASSLIHQLRDCTSEDQAQAFTNDLIARVNGVQGNINDDTLLTHINSAWTRVRRATQNELQELANERQNTHKREVHASVAASVKRLQGKYPEALKESDFDIFETLAALFQSVFPKDMSTKFDEAKASAIKLVEPNAIDSLLKISPHTRAAGNDADTALNLAARKLMEGKSQDAQKAIQEVVRLHAQKDHLTDALELLSYIKGLSTYHEKYTGLSYVDLLRLITAATQDEKSGFQGGTISERDIQDRWLSLMTRMARARNEYRDGGAACLAGIFNALLEPLSGVHPDVLIIMSFRATMQEISTEKDDAEFEHRIQVALSYLGENAAKDKDYKEVIEEFTAARKARQDTEEKLLEQLRTNLADLKDKTDAEFETQAANLMSNLPGSLKGSAATVVEISRRGRHATRFQSTLAGLSGSSLEDLKAKALEFLESYPEAYRADFERTLLRQAVQARALAQEEGDPEEVTPAATAIGEAPVPSGAAPRGSTLVDLSDVKDVTSPHPRGLGFSNTTDRQD